MKEYRVVFCRGDQDGSEDFVEFDSLEYAEIFYGGLNGMAEIQRYSEESHSYETIVYPEFEI